MEKFLLQIAKLLASSVVKRNLKQAERQINSDPEMVGLINGIQIQTKQLERILPKFCSRHPNHSLCKEHNNKVK